MLNQKKQDQSVLNKVKAIFFFLLLVIVAGCGPADITPTPPTDGNTPVPSQDGYPPPPAATIAPAEGYPAAVATPSVSLLLNKPIAAGAETVTGLGPPGLTVYVMNITFMGEQLGTAVVADDGTFS